MARILIVDDNAVIRDVVVFTLQDRHSVTAASGAKEALDLVDTNQFDLIITDIKMPEMSGLEFIKEVRANSSHVATPILVLTANLPDYKDDVKKAGATGWIIKPFKPEQLLETIANLIEL